MKRTIVLLLAFSLLSCRGSYKVMKPMSHMPAKWRPFFQEMAIITYKEYKETYNEEMAVKLTNEKMARLMLNMPEGQFKKFEESRFNTDK